MKWSTEAQTLQDVVREYKVWVDWHGWKTPMPEVVVKLCEELGELAHAVHRRQHAEILDAFADIFIVLLKVSHAGSFDAEQAIVKTWNQVRERDYTRE